MFKVILLIFSLVYLAGTMENPVKNSLGNAATEINMANNEFAFDVLKELIKEKQDKNLIYSPFCIIQVLSMILLGAEGSSFNQLLATLKYSHFYKSSNPKKQQIIHESLLKTVKDIKSSSKTTLNIANAIFPQINYTLNNKFITSVENYYGALVKNIDFQKPTEAINIINNYISEKTNKKINSLLPPGSLDESTRLVLTNAIYFKGFWEEQFDPTNTLVMDFNRDDKKVDKVKFMTGTKQAFYSTQNLTEHGVELEVLQMNYADNDLAFMILLPQQQAIDKLAQILTPDLMNKLRTEGRRQKINIAVPIFKIQLDLQLKSTLSQLGLTDIFDQKADLSGMVSSSGNPGLYVDEIYHKSFIDVNEAGSEATAAAGAVVNLRSFPINIRFTADRPFLYFILSKSTGTILFAGTYKMPPQP